MKQWGPLGVSLFALGLVVAGLIFATYAWNPVKTVENSVIEPVAHDIGLQSSRCHDGWRDISEGEFHTTTFICARGDWRVVLQPDGKTFDHAVELNNPQAVFILDENLVPGW